MKFPRGLLVDLAQSELEETDDWDVGYDSDTQDNYEVIYFLKKTEQILTPDESSNKVTLSLLKFCATASYQSETANIYLVYGPLMQDSSGGSLADTKPELKAIDIIDRASKSNIPLHVGFVGSQTILNDGDTQNSLTLRITNINSPNSVKPNLSLTSESKLIVSFDTGDGGNKTWALAEMEKVNQIAIAATDTGTWQIQQNPNLAEWTVSLQSGSKELTPGEFVELTLTNIVTGHPAGNANMYLRYEQIPDYRDGQFVVPVEKTPLLLRDGNIGISAKPPQGLKFSSPHSDAHIDFVLTSEANDNRAVLALNANGSTDFPERDRAAYIVSSANSANPYGSNLGFKVRSEGGNWQYNQIEDALTIQYNGNVGIGTTTPQGKLHLCHQSSQNGNTDLVIERQDHETFLKLKAQDDQARITFNKKLLFDSDDSGSTRVEILGSNNDNCLLHVNGRIKDKTGYVMPVGSIVAYAGSKAPEGWWLCDGRSLNKNQYPELFEAIGTTYGSSGDSFNLPNLKGRVPVGVDGGDSTFGALAKDGGEKTHRLSEGEMPKHSHGVTDNGHSHSIHLHEDGKKRTVKRGDDNGGGYASTESATTGIIINETGDGQAHNNLQPYLTVNYIIKA